VLERLGLLHTNRGMYMKLHSRSSAPSITTTHPCISNNPRSVYRTFTAMQR
jgi:hypothetical protein